MCVLLDADSVPADTGGSVELSFGPTVGILGLQSEQLYTLEFLRAEEVGGGVQLVEPLSVMFAVEFIYVPDAVVSIAIPPLPVGCELVSVPWVKDNPGGVGPDSFASGVSDYSSSMTWVGPEDCDGNGRLDSCDLEDPSVDLNQNGVIDTCEPSFGGITPAVGPAATGGFVDLDLPNLPDGPAELTLFLPTGAVTIPIGVASGSSTAQIPALGFTSEADVTADAEVRWFESGVEKVVSLAGAFSWEVPQVVGVVPSAVPFDGTTPVLVELRKNVVTSGAGLVWFGDAPAEPGSWLELGGVTYVATNAPSQPAPGDYPIVLEVLSDGVLESATVSSRGLVFLGPDIASISAIQGFQGGGETVVFELFGFEPGVPVEVAFGPYVTSGVPVGPMSSTSLAVLTPLAPEVGVVDITLTQDLSGGNVKTVTSPGAFEFIAPTVGDLDVVSGPQAGGEFVSVPVEGFSTGSVTIEMGGVSTTGVVTGVGPSQIVDWTTVAASAPGITDVRFTQSVFDVTKSAAYDYLAPALADVTPGEGAWYEGQSLTITGVNLAPNLPADVKVEGEAALSGTVISGSEIQVTVPADLFDGSGPLDVTVTQAGVEATLVDGYTVLPSLAVTVNGDSASGGTIDFQVTTEQGGFGYVYLAALPSPLPIPIKDVHGKFALDLGTALELGTGGLLVTPTLSVPFAAGYPPGTTVYCQGLALEFGAIGTYYSFTQVEPAVIP